jgi:hypothetical protein
MISSSDRIEKRLLLRASQERVWQAISDDAIPLDRRVDAFEANEEGWDAQLQLIEKYLRLRPA